MSDLIGKKVWYECYPHLNRYGGTRIHGTIEKLEGELIIRTCPEDMEHPTLREHSDYIALENAPTWEIDYYEHPDECPCHRCQLARGEEVTVLEHDYCYQIAYNIDEEGNYHDDEGDYRNGVTHEVIA